MSSSRIQLGLILIGLFLIFGRAFVVHYDNATNPYHFNDDARQQISPFVLSNASIPASYSSEYYLKVFSPQGFRLLYQWGAKVFDPRTISKALPYLLAFVMYAFIALSAWRLGGRAGCVSTLLLVLSADIFWARMMGGLPRSFAFPCIAASILFLIQGRVLGLGLIAVFGVAFYPTAGLVSIFSLALLLFAFPVRLRGSAEKWNLKERIVCISAVLLFSFVVVFPQLMSGSDYGKRIGIEQIDNFPEAGPGGRYGAGDRPPFSGLISTVLKHSAVTFYGQGPALVESWSLRYSDEVAVGLNIAVIFALLVIFSGIKAEWGQKPEFSRAFLLLPASLIGYFSADILYPYLFLPERFLAYSLPVFILVLFPACLLSLARKIPVFKEKTQWASGVVVVISAFLFIAFGSVGNGFSGYSVRVDNLKPIYDRIESLPEQSLIAGWPGGLVENISYLSARNVLIAYETHQAFHENYALEMRQRMDALVDAYFATDESSLIDLRSRFGVDFLLLDLRHFTEKPHYFKPFDKTLGAAIQRAKGKTFFLEKNYRPLTLFQQGPWVLLDLSRIEALALKGSLKQKLNE